MKRQSCESKNAWANVYSLDTHSTGPGKAGDGRLVEYSITEESPIARGMRTGRPRTCTPAPGVSERVSE